MRKRVKKDKHGDTRFVNYYSCSMKRLRLENSAVKKAKKKKKSPALKTSTEELGKTIEAYAASERKTPHSAQKTETKTMQPRKS